MASCRKSYKYKLAPTPEQAAKLNWTLWRCRELYNAALQERRDAWKMSQVSISYYQQKRDLPTIKELRPEYAEIHAHVLQDVLKRLDNAFAAFFRRVKHGEKPGYPRFQGCNRYQRRFEYSSRWASTSGANVTCWGGRSLRSPLPFGMGSMSLVVHFVQDNAPFVWLYSHCERLLTSEGAKHQGKKRPSPL